MINYLNTDCFETMKNLSNIDAIITDIPYGINFHGEKDPDTDWDKFEKEEYKNLNKYNMYYENSRNRLINNNYKVGADTEALFNTILCVNLA